MRSSAAAAASASTRPLSARPCQSEKVIGIGRNPLRPEPFSLNIEKREGYEYHARHVTHELDLLLELLDREKPEVIVNFAAQGEGAVRGSIPGASSRPTRWRWRGLRRTDEARLAGALHPDRHLGNVRLGEPCRQGRRTDQALQPLRRVESGVRHVSDIGAPVPEIPDEHHPALQCLLPGPAAPSGDPEGGLVRAEGRQAAAAWRRTRRKILHPCPRSRPRHPFCRREGAARHHL